MPIMAGGAYPSHRGYLTTTSMCVRITKMKLQPWNTEGLLGVVPGMDNSQTTFLSVADLHSARHLLHSQVGSKQPLGGGA